MDKLTELKDTIKEEFAQYEAMYNGAFSTGNPLLKEVYERVSKRKGKQLRPIMSLIAAKACGKITESTYYAAMILELLHNTTLIHDDVVDEAETRRGRMSINKEFGNKVAVLAGDYLLAQIFGFTNRIKDERILDAVSELGKELSEGEILQLMHSGSPNFDVERYIEVITKKTAVLFSTCMHVGAVSSGTANEKVTEALKEYGRNLGICFQMKDDVFDYMDDEKEIGKPTGNDIKEKKVTLPLIYAYEKMTDDEKQKATETLRKDEDLNEDEIRWFVEKVREKGGIEMAEETMREYQKRAAENLEILPDTECKRTLNEMLKYVVERGK